MPFTGQRKAAEKAKPVLLQVFYLPLWGEFLEDFARAIEQPGDDATSRPFVLSLTQVASPFFLLINYVDSCMIM